MKLVWTDGQVYDVKDDKVNEALAQGFRTVEQAATEDVAKANPLRAGIEGAARGLTFGVSDEVSKGLGEVAGQSSKAAAATLKASKELNPVASTVGEIGGQVAGALAGPGAVVGELGAGAKVLAGGGKWLGTAAQFGTEGSLYGLGSAISESALNDTDLTASKAALSMLSGGVSAAGLGVGLQGLGTGAKAVLNKIRGSDGLSGTLRQAAQEAELGMVLGKKDLATIPDSEKAQLAEMMHAEGIKALDDTATLKATAARERYGGEIAKHLDALKGSEPFNTAGYMGAIRQKMNEFDTTPAFKKGIGEVESLIEDLPNYKKFSWQEAWDMQSTLRDRAKAAFKAGDRDTGKVLKSAQMAIEDHIASAAEPLLGSESGSLHEAVKNFAISKRMEDKVHAAVAGFNSRGVGFKESLGAAVMSGMAEEASSKMGLGLASVAALNQIRKRGGFLYGSALRALEDSGTLNGVAATFQKQVLERLNNPAVLGAFAAPVEAAAAKGGWELVQDHIKLAQGPQGEEYMKAMGLEHETPEQADQYAQRIGVLNALDESNIAHSESINKGIDGFFSSPGAGVASAPARSKADFEAKKSDIETLTKHPEDVFKLLPKTVMMGAPAVGSGIAAKYIEAAQFLQSKLPQDPNAGLPKGLQRPWEPSSTDIAQFFRYVDAVENHDKVIKELQNGRIAKEHVETLEALFPKVYEDLKIKLTDRLSTLEKPLPFQKRVGLSYILGENALGLQGPNVKVLQQMHAKMNEVPQGKKPDGRQNVSAVENMQTQAQRIEGR